MSHVPVSVKSGGISKQRREDSEEEEAPVHAVAQVGGDKAVFSELPSVKEKGVTTGVLKL